MAVEGGCTTLFQLLKAACGKDVYERSLLLVKLRTFNLFLEDEATKCLRRRYISPSFIP